MEKIEVLISTMNIENMNFFESMNTQSDAVIINQTEKKLINKIYDTNGYKVKIISTREKGLSKSRNLAITHSSADICIISDDDVVFDTDYKEKILDAYDKFPEADIIAFQVKRIGNTQREKKFRNSKSWENYITSMKISSVEITFRLDKIKQNNLQFNPNIGAGTGFYNGEENIFLYDALRKGLKVLYLPINIAEVDVSESSWFEGYTQDYFKTVGAKYYNMSQRYYPVLIFQFALRKHKMFKNKVSFFEAIKLMNLGVRKYKKMHL